MRRIVLLLLFFGSFVGTARGQTGTINLTVTSTPTPITVNQACNYVVIQENSANPTNAFTITLPGGSTGINYPAGTKFIFTAAAGGFVAGQTIGSISISTGSASFVGIESIAAPTIPSVKSSGGGGGAGNPASPANCAQFSNATVSAFGTALVGGICIGVDSISPPATILTIPVNLNVTGNGISGTKGNVSYKPGFNGPTFVQNGGQTYAAPWGNDTNDCLSWGSACATLYQASLNLPSANASATPPKFGTGTVFFANGTAAHPTATCGIWMMSSSDPNFSSPPACWAQQNSVSGSQSIQYIGVGCQQSGAVAQDGQCAITGGSRADNNHPLFWLQAVNISIKNAYNSTGAIGLRLGIDSNGLRTGDVGAALLTFINCNWAINATSTTLGPPVDIGSNVFEVLFRDGMISANGTGTAGADSNQSVVVNPSTGAGSGTMTFEHVGLVNGSIKIYPGSSGGGTFTFRDIVTEAISQGHGAIWLTSTSSTTAPNVIDNVFAADGTGAACEIDGNGPSDAVVVLGVNQSCTNGPSTQLGLYEAGAAVLTTIPSKQHISGVLLGHLYGQQDSSRRQFSPTAVRYSNLALTNPASWTGTGTITTGITAPDGTTGAATISGALAVNGKFYDQTVTYAVGDYIIVGAWARSRNGSWPGTNVLQTFTGASGFALSDISGFSYATNGASIVGLIQGDCTNGNPPCQWDWYSHAYKLSAIGTNPAEWIFQGLADATHPTDYYAPVYIHIAAGTIDDNEVAEIAANLQPYDHACTVGSLCNLTGESTALQGSLTATSVSSGVGFNIYADSGVANAYTITQIPCPSTLTNGLTITMQAGTSNSSTGPSTLNDCSLGAKPIKVNGGNGSNIGSDTTTGSIKGGGWYTFVYDTTSSIWECNGSCGGSGGGGGGTVSTTGSPATGELAAFSAGLTITNTNLTGDVISNPTNTVGTKVSAIQTIPVNTSNVQVGQIFNVVAGPQYINTYPGVNYNPQTTTYSVACPSDRLGYVDFTGSSATTFTLPQAGSTACLGSSWAGVIANHGTAALTLAATTSTIDGISGATGITIASPSALFVYSDNTNYHTISVPEPFGGINTQTASYTATLLDKNHLIVMNCSSACTLTLPNPPPSARWNLRVLSIGSTLAGVSLNSLNFNGASAVPVLNKFQELDFYTDGSNYFGSAPLLASTNVTFTPSSNQLAISATGGGGGSTTIQLNGTPITTQSPFNIQNTTGVSGVSWTNPSAGNVQGVVANIQGTDSKLLSAGTISSTPALPICSDANAGATTTGCVGAAQITAAGSFWMAFTVGVTPSAGASATLSQAANVPEIFEFNLPYQAKVSEVTFDVIAAAATSTGDLGMYDTTGTLVWHTGSITTTATGIQTISITPVTMNPGQYYWAACESSTSVTFTSISAANAPFSAILGAASSPAHSWGNDATDTCTAGVLPGTITIANITNQTGSGFVPIMAKLGN